MPSSHFPLRWESTGDQWWYAAPIDVAAANGHYDLVRELIRIDNLLLFKLTSLRRIRRLETLWDGHDELNEVARCRAHVAKNLLSEFETKAGQNSLIRAGYGGWLLYTAASAGDTGFVQELLELDPLLVFGEGEYGITDVLYAAARSKSSEVFKLLLSSAIGSRNFGEEGDELCGGFRWEIMNRAVHSAARGGGLKVLKEVLLGCNDVLAYRDNQGSTILHSAAGGGQVKVVKDLIASYQIIDSTDHQGNTALHIAAYNGFFPVVETLIAASPSMASSTNNSGDTFLHMAVAGFQAPGFHRLDQQLHLLEQIVSGKLINIQDTVNFRNNNGRTALQIAMADNIQSDAVELLMKIPNSKLLINNRTKSSDRTAMSEQAKLQGCVWFSPGTSFGVPDSGILLYGDDGKSPEASCFSEQETLGQSKLVRLTQRFDQTPTPLRRRFACSSEKSFDVINGGNRKSYKRSQSLLSKICFGGQGLAGEDPMSCKWPADSKGVLKLFSGG